LIIKTAGKRGIWSEQKKSRGSGDICQIKKELWKREEFHPNTQGMQSSSKQQGNVWDKALLEASFKGFDSTIADG